MNTLVVISSIPIAVLTYYYLIKNPKWLLGSYLTALLILPPIPIGAIEISILEFLTIPTLICLIYNFSKNKFQIKGLLPVGFLRYVIAAIISVISFSFQASLFEVTIMLRVVRLFEMALPIILASQMIDSFEKDFPIIPFLVGSAVAAVIGVYMYTSGISLRDSQSFASGGELIFRAGGTHGDSGSFGTLMGISSLISIWVLIYFKNPLDKLKTRRFKIIALVSVACTLLGLVATLSRGGFFLLAIGVIVLLVPLLKRPQKFIKVIAVAFILFLAALPIIETFSDDSLLTIGYEFFLKRITGMTELADNANRVSGGRVAFWQMGWDLYSGNPLAWPFGLGYKSLGRYYDIEPDNNFNQSLFEMGIFGAISLLVILASIFLVALRCLKTDSQYGILIMALWFSILSNMLSADVLTYWHNVPAIFIFLIIITQNGRHKEININQSTE